MKALKEKRIGLRSLLRRGLVILSLFALALAFASCDQTDSDDSDDGDKTVDKTTGPKPSRIEIIAQPTASSFEGLPVDLTGLKVRVYYDDSPTSAKTLTKDDTKFYTYPPVAVGVIGEATGSGGDFNAKLVWVPQLQYTLLWYSGDEVFTAVLDLDKSTASPKPTVRAISRSDKWTELYNKGGTWTYENEDTKLAWSKGLRLTGSLEEKIYVDDYPDLSKYRLQAEYTTGAVKEITLKSDTDWRIVPKYNSATNPTSATGDLFITVGTNPVVRGDEANINDTHPYVKHAYTKGGFTSNAKDESGEVGVEYEVSFPTTTAIYTVGTDTLDPGLTIRQPYAEIYIVKSIKFVAEPKLDDFFYWDTDTPAKWLERLKAAKAEIEVTYTGGSPKTFSTEYLDEMNKVWYNEPFNDVTPDFENDVPFKVLGINASSPNPAATPFSKNKDPKITINYRGARTFLQVPVYTRLTAFTVTPVDAGESVPVDMRQRDNDVGRIDAAVFGGLVKAVATFSAFMDSDKTADLTVTFNADTIGTADRTGGDVDTNASSGLPAKDRAKNYSNNFYNVSREIKNNGRDTAVVFYYASPKMNDTNTDPGNLVQIASRKMSARVPVAWSNIQNTAPEYPVTP